jgi:hypothetical protein
VTEKRGNRKTQSKGREIARKLCQTDGKKEKNSLTSREKKDGKRASDTEM